MRLFVYSLMLGAAALPSLPAQSAAPIDVRVDRRIELMSIIFRLAGADEFKSPYPSYSAAIDTFFIPYKAHPAVAAARRLRAERGIGWDAVMSFAVHLTDVPDLRARMPFASSQLETRWKADEAASFARLVHDFAADAKAVEFFASQRSLYELTEQRMKRLIDEQVDQAWFPRFFGVNASSQFVLAVALNNGGIAYGTRFVPPRGPTEVYAVINAMELDAASMPRFSVGYVPTIAHEFSHSFVNPIVDAHLRDITPAADSIHSAFDAAMSGQGYPQPRTMISESIVRAAVARYVYDHKGVDSADAELSDQRVRSFLWIDDLFALLGSYSQNRQTYPSMNAYWPVLAGYFRDLGPRVSGLIAQADSRRPRIASITPADGSVNVDPSTTRIVITFDRPMRGSYATMVTAGRDKFPPTSASGWDSTGRVYTMTVKLEPNKSYEFGLNSARAAGFASREGYTLTPVIVRFATSAGASK